MKRIESNRSIYKNNNNTISVMVERFYDYYFDKSIEVLPLWWNPIIHFYHISIPKDTTGYIKIYTIKDLNNIMSLLWLEWEPPEIAKYLPK